jgi:hypothetical protein
MHSLILPETAADGVHGRNRDASVARRATVSNVVSIGIPRRSSMVVPLLAAAALLCCLALGGGAEGLLCLAPALALACLLLARRYPGERLLRRLATRTHRTRRARAGLAARLRAGGARHMPRGGLLMGFSLAVRPPPPASCAS